MILSSGEARPPTEVFVASEEIPSDTFLPRFLKESSQALVRNRGSVGIKGFTWREYERFSPYIMLSDICIGPPLLFPDHPHCGHEFVLYVLDGTSLLSFPDHFPLPFLP